jgi:hypothetical protein
MSGFTEHKSGRSERRGAVERLLTWNESQAMLPLVGPIARELRDHRKLLERLRPEAERLEQKRHNLDWPQRQRRYQLQDEIRTAEAELHNVEMELDALGVAVLDGDSGLIGFPTLVNNRQAYFSWMPDEEKLQYWNFAGDDVRRPIPEDWTKPREAAPAPKAKTRK